MEGEFILVYVKDGIAYPVALADEQKEMFKISLSFLEQPICVAFKHPMGKV